MTYISGKITGLDIDLARLNFKSAELKLFPEITINPMEIKPLFGISNWIFHMIPDIWELIGCTSVYFMSNWKDSKGARIEHYIAKLIKIDIRYE